MDFDRKYCPECYSLLGEGDYDYVTGHSDYICGCCGWKGTDRTALSCEKKVLLCMKDLLEETFTDEAVKKLMPIIRDDVFDYMKKYVDDDFATNDIKPYVSKVIFKYIATSTFLKEKNG